MALRTLKVQQIWNHLATLTFVLSINQGRKTYVQHFSPFVFTRLLYKLKGATF